MFEDLLRKFQKWVAELAAGINVIKNLGTIFKGQMSVVEAWNQGYEKMLDRFKGLPTEGERREMLSMNLAMR